MSDFIGNITGRLAAMELQAQALPGHIGSILICLDRNRLRRLFLELSQEHRKLIEDEESVAAAFSLALALTAFTRGALNEEEVSSLKGAYTPDIRIMVGNEKVKPIPLSKIARESNVTVSQIIRIVRQQGYMVLDWGQYQRLLDEISKLVRMRDEG